ncbi:hypothetical protein GJ496_008981 [Pomphorhynchus laevis]|nr:hypothetical protein GJ496_008981 [Pomphorhynchus laevis]
MKYHIYDRKLRSKLDLESDVQPIKESILTNFEGDFTGVFYLQLTSVVCPVLAIVIENFFLENVTVLQLLYGLIQLFSYRAFQFYLFSILQLCLTLFLQNTLQYNVAIQIFFVILSFIYGHVLYSIEVRSEFSGPAIFILCLFQLDLFCFLVASIIKKRVIDVNADLIKQAIFKCVQCISSIMVINIIWKLVFIPEKRLLANQNDLKYHVGKILLCNCPTAGLVALVSYIQKLVWFYDTTNHNWEAFSWLDFDSIADFWHSLTPNMYEAIELLIMNPLLKFGYSIRTITLIQFTCLGIMFQWIYYWCCTTSLYAPIIVILIALCGYVSPYLNRFISRSEFFAKSSFFFVFLTVLSCLLLYTE